MARLVGSSPSSAALTCGRFDEVGLAQHEADVGIGDQEAVAVDHVRLALVADLDARHHVPDELEVHVGDRHGPRCRRPSGCAIVMYGSVSLRKYTGPNQGWPRLALRNAGSCERSLPELDRCPCRGATRAICSRPVGVELRDVRDLGRLAQQLQELDAAQLDVARIELRQRRVGELLLDLPDVLLDARRRGDRLLVLQARRARPCFPGRRSRC